MQLFSAIIAVAGLGFAQSAGIPPVVPEPRDDALPPAVIPEPRQSTGCSYDYTFPSIGSKAVIQSPNYPNSYPPNMNCQYILRGPTGSKISMDCDVFNVEPETNCLFDYFMFSVSGDLSFRDAGRVCGQGTLMGRNSTGNILTISFKSDGANPWSATPYSYRCYVQAVESTSTAAAAPAATTVAPTTTRAPATAVPTTTKAPAAVAPAAATSTTTACSCGQRNEIPRIVGGTEAQVNEFPWRCSLYAESMGVFCGATVLSSTWVLTAAHCTNAIPGGTVYYVNCGDHDISKASEANNTLIKVVQAIQHASYNSNTQDNDISLLKLEKALPLNKEIQPVCLPYKMVNASLTGTTVTASGWGTTSSGGSQSMTLLKVDLPVLTTTECKKHYGNAVTDNMICTYNPGKDTCQGDSGGSIDYKDPATGKYMNIGVVSWGVGCAGVSQPGVYANVMNYLNWIESKTASTFCKV